MLQSGCRYQPPMMCLSGLHQFLNPLKQRQIVLLNPLIEQSLVVIENKTVVILAEICRRMEGGEGRGNALSMFQSQTGSRWALQMR